MRTIKTYTDLLNEVEVLKKERDDALDLIATLSSQLVEAQRPSKEVEELLRVCRAADEAPHEGDCPQCCVKGALREVLKKFDLGAKK